MNPDSDSTTNRDDVMATGPPVGLDIGILAGPMPDDVAAHAQPIADNLGVAEVRGGIGPGANRANKHQ